MPHDNGHTVAARHDATLTPYILGFEDAIRNAGTQTFGGRLLAVLIYEVGLVTKLVATGKTDDIEAGYKAFVQEIRHAQGWLENGVV